MARDSAEIRGRAKVRPYRVAQLIDTTSADEVRAAIANLTEAWGGIYTPILDVNQPFESIERQARLFDVDALHLEAEGGDLVEKLRRSGWLWRGRGEFGPFSSEDGLRTGVLPARAVALDHPPLLLPKWDPGDTLDLFYTAVFGAPAKPNPDGVDGDNPWEPDGSLRIGLGALYRLPDVTLGAVGTIQATNLGVSPAVRHALDGMNGLFVVRPDRIQDLVTFWNLRSFGGPIVALPAEGPKDLLSFLTRGTLPGGETRYGGPNPRVEKHLGVWGLQDAADATRTAIDAMAARLQMTVLDRHHRRDELHFMFPGLDTRFESSVRAEFPPTARSVMVRVPTVSLVPGVHQVMPGTVAVEINLHDISGLDPRLTASLPPLRRFGSLLERSGISHAEHVRITSEGNGVVLGVSATSDEVPIGFAYNLDAISTLFDDEDLMVSQSDVGRFQTRAAEMLGGPFGGVMVQPGVRALIAKVARSNAGLTHHQLKAEVKKNHGAWPDKLTAFRATVDDYVDYTVNNLLFTGLFVPMLDVHCSNCRVESQVSARDLDATIQCEFCGENFRLALSLSLSKSRWRYRLASHLGPEKVKALLPALATMSLLGQMSTENGGSTTHAFGVAFKFAGGDSIEADVVAYLGWPDWTVALGEVKNSNWIDANDVENLEQLQRRLSDKSVRSILIFATLKDRLAPEEVAVLRPLVERSTELTTAFGDLVPRLPLVLTAKDLSLPWNDDGHPNRWTQAGTQGGIFATAIESCRRNLGLAELRFDHAEDGHPPECTWQDPQPESTEPERPGETDD